jgi:adenosine deaminase
MTGTAGILREELHLHLYGCLTPADIFALGRDRFRERTAALEWYADEYLKHTGTAVDWQTYFHLDGPERISKDFLADRPMTFPEFQARFNLMIALLPTVTHAATVLEQVVHGQVRDGLTYAEHRVFVPPVLSRAELASYYRDLAAAAARLNSMLAGQFAVRLILSVSRNPAVFAEQYTVLKDLQSEKDIREQITGVDFCGVEEGFPPELQTDVFRRILSDNRAAPERSLALLYHVGESFDGMSIFSAMRWVHAAAAMGAHRLGHATAAAVPPTCLTRFADGCSGSEPRQEAAALLQFISRHPAARSEPALDEIRTLWQRGLAAPGTGPLTFTWNPTMRQAAAVLQKIVQQDLRTSSAVIESCPTSNRIIGRIETVSALPAFHFAQADIQLVLSSDDPGIFATSLAAEEDLCRRGGMSAKHLSQAAARNQTKRAGLLAGRAHW